MTVFDNEWVVTFDVDDTLVMWNPPSDSLWTESFLDPYDGSTNILAPHKKHIALLKKYKGRGMFVIVWSAAGTKWAQSVINTLGLSEFVDVVMTKPSKYVDDLPASEILGSRVYLK